MFYAIIDTLDYPETQIELAELALTELFNELDGMTNLFNMGSMNAANIAEQCQSIADSANDLLAGEIVGDCSPPCIIWSTDIKRDMVTYLDPLQAMARLTRNPFYRLLKNQQAKA